ncbi:hypothetical protein [Nocardia sp. NPDC050717]|uniref:hypothetical protein n=1 Tax=Nocardia sp. NPDC050717 TaxID=3157221 RepID=UPI0033E4DB00
MRTSFATCIRSLSITLFRSSDPESVCESPLAHKKPRPRRIQQFQSTDDPFAQAITSLAATMTTGPGDGGASGDGGVTRSTVLQLPTLPSIEDGELTVRKVVDSAIELLAHFDEGFIYEIQFRSLRSGDGHAWRPTGHRTLP